MADDHRVLVQLASEGAGIERLLDRHLPGLRAFIRLRSGRVVRERESCSDLAQSVCREVLENLGDFEYRGEAAFRAWLYEMALSKIRDRMRYYGAQKRHFAREARAPESGPGDDALRDPYASVITPSREAIGRETLRRIEAAFDELPDDQREVVTLARIVGLTRRQIAERLGKTEDAVRGLLRRGLAKVHWILTRHGSGDTGADGGEPAS